MGSAVSIDSETLENKAEWLEIRENGNIKLFFVIDCFEESLLGVDDGVGVDVTERDS